MNGLTTIFERIVSDKRYLRNIEYGKARIGHAEGSVKAHIAQLETNLDKLAIAPGMELETYWKLKILIHVHDSFKMDAKRDSAILDPMSHASLATKFLAEFMPNSELLDVCQFHDIGYAVYKKYKAKGVIDDTKLMTALATISNMDLFLMFAIIDSCTESKGREMITWLVKYVHGRYGTRIHEGHILPGLMVAEGAW